MKPFRVAYLVSHPIQYQAPLLRRLAAHPDIALQVYYMDDQGARSYADREFGVQIRWDIPLLEGYAWRRLRNVSPWGAKDHFLRFVHPEIVVELRRQRYDALIVHGYAYATQWLAFVGAWMSRTPLFLRGESTLAGRRAAWLRLGKRLALGWLCRRLQGALAIGRLNREFYRAYGLSEDQIFWVPYAVDNDRFLAEAQRLQGERVALRERLGWPRDLPICLFVGKLIPRKRPLDLLEAYAIAAAEAPAALVFLGDGSERRRVEARVRARGLRHVSVTGFVNQGEIPAYYAAADILVLPSSHEPWGLALNEGMCFGLPVVASDAVGAVPDLVHPGENGFVYPVGDVSALASHLRTLLRDPDRRRKMADRSREIVTSFSYDADIRGILAALRSVASTASAGHGPVSRTVPDPSGDQRKGVFKAR